ncbi:hypothetical protein R1flu_009262 [Riccia fluitans]|uniref:BED-type domain-containing protein n=1 Tax=Riccia fluitans TaxID=41844 RepID=A0ABD1Z2F2_9MARC
MALGSRRREGKLPKLPELLEERELMPQQQQQPRAPKARQTVLPFVEPPIPRPSKYKEFGLPEPKKQLSIKVMEQFIFIRDQKNNVEGVWCKCKWCGNEYAHKVTRLTQHFRSEFAPRQRGNMELPAFRRKGSNKHIKDCERASQQLKFKIRALNNKEQERATELSSLHDMASTSRALDEEREIESAFPSSIRDELSSPYAGRPQGSDPRPHKSNFSSPSSVANTSTHSDSNPIFSQTLPQHSVQPPFKRTYQLPLSPILDVIEREKADRLWAMAQAVMGLPFWTFSHPAFQEAYKFSS